MVVLVIDDEEQTRDLITKSLKAQQYEIVTLRSSLEAIKYMRSHPAPDVMLVDYELPGGPNGLAVAHQARLLYPNCVIIMMSQCAQREDIVDAFQVRVDDFILKPIKPEVLVSRIGNAFVQRQMSVPHQEPTQPTGPLKLNLATHTAEWYGETLPLTIVEFELLKHLTSHPGHVLGYSKLYALSQGEHINPEIARRRLKTHITNLRRKLQRVEYPESNPIQAVRGLGFKWEINETAPQYMG